MTDIALDENILTWRAKSRVGSVLRGKWRLDRLLGVGGMAAVYEGVHRNGKRGAVKVLHLELSMHPDARTRFLQEGYVANRVDHPGAVSVLDDDVAEDGSVFLVMELLEGRTLEDLARARQGGVVGAGEALALLDQLLDVLAAAHDKGIVHRDIKPENLFLTHDGRVKVLDFGLARVRELQGQARLTKTGNAMGTPAFLPPEQAQGHWDKVDGRTDLWAAGATVFTMLTGRLVHEAPNLNQLLLAAMTHGARPVRQVSPEVPKPLAAIVDRALAFEQKDRWADARAMQRAVREARQGLPAVDLAALARETPVVVVDEASSDRLQGAGASLLGSSMSHAQDTTLWRRRRSRKPVAIAAAGAALLAGVIALVALRSPGPSGPPGSAAGGQTPNPADMEAAPNVRPQGPVGPPGAAPTGMPADVPEEPLVFEPANPSDAKQPKAPPSASPSSKPSAKPGSTSDPFLNADDFRKKKGQPSINDFK